MAEYDLTTKIASYLDRHLVFPLLEFLAERKVETTYWTYCTAWVIKCVLNMVYL